MTSFVSLIRHTVDKCTHMGMIKKLNIVMSKVSQESQEQKFAGNWFFPETS